MRTLICIGGPTASGKTGLAIRLAQLYSTEIISFDSRQIYSELNIGVARPAENELNLVKHHFIASHQIKSPINAGTYVELALDKLNRLFQKYETVIAVGGNGFYLQKLLEPMDEIPTVSSESKQFIASGFLANGIEWLRSYVQTHDPVQYESMDNRNPVRLQRVAEVIKQTGKPFSAFLKKKIDIRLPMDRTMRFALMPPRSVLYKRIDSRVEQMLSDGLVDEVKSLLVFKSLNALNTVGYKEIFDWIDGMSDFATAIESIKQNSRNYAKRQYTWFRNQGDWIAIEDEDIEQQINLIKNKI